MEGLDLLETLLRKGDPALHLLRHEFQQVLVDNVADMLEIYSEGDHFHGPSTILIAQAGPRNARHIELHRLVQLIHRIVHIGDVLDQLAIVSFKRDQTLPQHGLDHVTDMERLPRGAGERHRRRGDRRLIQIKGR